MHHSELREVVHFMGAIDRRIRVEIVRRLRRGERSTSIAKSFDISASTVQNYARKEGIKLSHKGVYTPKPELLARDEHIKELLFAGYAPQQAAAITGVSVSVVYRLRSRLMRMKDRVRSRSTVAEDPSLFGFAPPMKVGRGLALSLEERVFIYHCLGSFQTHREIAAQLGRSQSTISREIARNTTNGRYFPGSAHRHAEQARKRPKPRKIDSNPVLRRCVVSLLNRGASPDQISARQRFLYPDNETMHISHESIYQALYIQGAGSLRQELKVEKALRSGRTARIPKSPLDGVTTRGRRSWVHGAEISLRPPEADDRAIPGHWEGDLIIGKGGKSALITLVERRSRFVLIRRLATDHSSATVIEQLQDMIASLPQQITTLTWDQGPEMSNVADLKTTNPIDVYFADPHSPWQRPSNERTNRHIREYFPKGTDFADITDQAVAHTQDLLNDRPRVVLNGQTPREVLQFNLH